MDLSDEQISLNQVQCIFHPGNMYFLYLVGITRTARFCDGFHANFQNDLSEKRNIFLHIVYQLYVRNSFFACF